MEILDDISSVISFSSALDDGGAVCPIYDLGPGNPASLARIAPVPETSTPFAIVITLTGFVAGFSEV
jgi:hypothetical protein